MASWQPCEIRNILLPIVVQYDLRQDWTNTHPLSTQTFLWDVEIVKYGLSLSKLNIIDSSLAIHKVPISPVISKGKVDSKISL